MYHRSLVLVSLITGASLLFSAPISAQDSRKNSSSRKHILATLESVQWSPVPNVDGIAVAVLEGDPNVEGSAYTIWVKAKEGTPGGVVPFHWHPH